jgi:hypothetical protein
MKWVTGSDVVALVLLLTDRRLTGQMRFPLRQISLTTGKRRSIALFFLISRGSQRITQMAECIEENSIHLKISSIIQQGTARPPLDGSFERLGRDAHGISGKLYGF